MPAERSVTRTETSGRGPGADWQALASFHRAAAMGGGLGGTYGPNVEPSTAEGARNMDAITMLKEDHDKVKRLLAQLESTTERGVKTRQELFATIKGELTVHEIVEEEIFYPELKAHPKARDIVLEGYEEHHVVDVLMGELEGLDVSDETWGAKATVMKENIEHHIEEEEGEMFTKARQVFERAELVDLGERMAARKKSAKAELNIP
jgi:hemerythrin-like domain-containing protein